MKRPLITLLAITGIFFLMGCTGTGNEEETSIESETKTGIEETVVVESETEVKVEEGNVEKVPVKKDEAMIVIEKPGVFEIYSKEKFDMLRGEVAVALFFHSATCDACITVENEINANIANLPANSTILKVDFDTEIELRKEFNIVTSPTLVYMDKDGTITDRQVVPSFTDIKTALFASLQ